MIQPEVIEFQPTERNSPRIGLYILRWPKGERFDKSPRSWYEFYKKKTLNKTTISEREETFLYDGVKIFRYPSLTSICILSDFYIEIDEAVERYFMRRKHKLPHPFAEPKEDEASAPGENTAKEGPFK